VSQSGPIGGRAELAQLAAIVGFDPARHSLPVQNAEDIDAGGYDFFAGRCNSRAGSRVLPAESPSQHDFVARGDFVLKCERGVGIDVEQGSPARQSA
jgi:hypothetical protein